MIIISGAILTFYAVVFSALRKANTTVETQLKSDPEAKPEVKRDASVEKYHVIFSTDCSGYQRWQSYLFFHNAMKIQQPGIVTRIASGCTEQQAAFEMEWHNLYIQQPMSNRFMLHLTPDFTAVKDAEGKTTGSYEFFNKPFGLKHWMENSQHGFMKIRDAEYAHELDDTFIMLLDPDMVLLKPITNDLSTHFTHPTSDQHHVQIGKPFAQFYGFGNGWMKLDLVKVTGDANTPAKSVSSKDGLEHFPVGPPYIVAVPDMYRIASYWSLFVPKVHEQYPYLLAEMFAYCIAAAHLKLPHTLLSSGMVSNTEMSAKEEGWSVIDEVEYNDQCPFAKKVQTADQWKRHVKSDTAGTTPIALHYCQRYGLGGWFFGKRRVPKDFFFCKSPLLKSPDADLKITAYDYWIPPPPSKGQKPEAKRMINNVIRRKREAFMLCFLIRVMNEASTFFKKNHCTDGNMTEAMELFYE